MNSGVAFVWVKEVIKFSELVGFKGEEDITT